MLAPPRLSFVITGNPFFFGMQIGLQNLTTKEISSNSYRHGRVNHKCYMAICLKFFLFFFSFICLSMLLSPLDNCEPYLRQILNSLIPSFHFFQCSVVRGTRCSEDSECTCVMSRSSPSLICSYRNWCEEKSPLDEIWRKLPVSSLNTPEVISVQNLLAISILNPARRWRGKKISWAKVRFCHLNIKLN